MSLYLELKAAGFTDQVLETVAAYGLLDRTTIISFDYETLDPAREAGVPIGVVGTTPSTGLIDDAIENDADVVFSHYAPLAASRFVDRANDAGLTSGIWKLLETSGTLHDSLESGPDVFVTNYPDEAIELLDE